MTPLSATALANALELSSTFQPVMSTACAPVLVSSNQSAPNGLLPLLHGAASETTSAGAIAPGEPVSPPGEGAVDAGDAERVTAARRRRCRT